jgi:hypothetical protein
VANSAWCHSYDLYLKIVVIKHAEQINNCERTKKKKLSPEANIQILKQQKYVLMSIVHEYFHFVHANH